MNIEYYFCPSYPYHGGGIMNLTIRLFAPDGDEKCAVFTMPIHISTEMKGKAETEHKGPAIITENKTIPSAPILLASSSFIEIR